jgi:hypothetical protein
MPVPPHPTVATIASVATDRARGPRLRARRRISSVIPAIAVLGRGSPALRPADDHATQPLVASELTAGKPVALRHGSMVTRGVKTLPVHRGGPAAATPGRHGASPNRRPARRSSNPVRLCTTLLQLTSPYTRDRAVAPTCPTVTVPQWVAGTQPTGPAV